MEINEEFYSTVIEFINQNNKNVTDIMVHYHIPFGQFHEQYPPSSGIAYICRHLGESKILQAKKVKIDVNDAKEFINYIDSLTSIEHSSKSESFHCFNKKTSIYYKYPLYRKEIKSEFQQQIDDMLYKQQKYKNCMYRKLEKFCKQNKMEVCSTDPCEGIDIIIEEYPASMLINDEWYNKIGIDGYIEIITIEGTSLYDYLNNH